MNLEKKSLLYDGKSKTLFEIENSDLAIQLFKDDATAFNAQKKGKILNKGKINNGVSSLLFTYLKSKGVPSHFIEKVSEIEMLVQKLTIIPVEVVVRNRAAGSLCKRLGIERGKTLQPPLVEYFLKNDELGDPLISEGHIEYFNWALPSDLMFMKNTALRVNEELKKVFQDLQIDLVDFKLEFGKNSKNELLLADEITLDGCRLWDFKTGESLDKDQFRLDLGRVDEVYEEIYQKLQTYFKGKL